MDERLTVDAARALISGALTGSGCSVANAGYFTEAILDTEMSGLEGHGFYWLQFYCEHLRSGKVKGRVRPKVQRLSPVSFRIDAAGGFAHPAIEKGFQRLIPAAQRYGIAAMAIHNSYNAATLGFHTEGLAKAGLVALGFTNSVPAIAPVGGSVPVIGTNPMSFAVPGAKGAAFVIDQSSSAVAWTAVNRAAMEGRDIPLGWALDAAGAPTTDAKAGLAGSMAPSGGYKGFGQGLIVEVMCAAVAGALRGPEMGSFVDNDGRMIGCGQVFIAIEPQMFSGGLFAGQIAALCDSITAQPGARLPNARRVQARIDSGRDGVKIEAALLARLRALSGKGRAAPV
ncbi:MAG: Ldh family oxidoreductase [Paracoccaceae bacterium]